MLFIDVSVEIDMIARQVVRSSIVTATTNQIAI